MNDDGAWPEKSLYTTSEKKEDREEGQQERRIEEEEEKKKEGETGQLKRDCLSSEGAPKLPTP